MAHIMVRISRRNISECPVCGHMSFDINHMCCHSLPSLGTPSHTEMVRLLCSQLTIFSIHGNTPDVTNYMGVHSESPIPLAANFPRHFDYKTLRYGSAEIPFLPCGLWERIINRAARKKGLEMRLQRMVNVWNRRFV
ncbi:hypothetical protein BJV74DRAFT_276874 [Russula compacta]|nr:hypothetical protein BJV74DRAFT_276874 [Russula compacta]